VLGNHDRRLSNVNDLAYRIRELGHFDLGRHDQCVDLPSGTRIELRGNELPWLDRHQSRDWFPGKTSQQAALATDTAMIEPAMATHEQPCLRIAVSHSPDQIQWARQHGFDLLLAGHTHGGQVRLPGIGPLVSPSMYGSRFASGVFFLKPTLLHVSRGVSGTHGLRWRCMPEVSILTLHGGQTRSEQTRSEQT
jgi:predicted MPP superfamily phosphohydrolase